MTVVSQQRSVRLTSHKYVAIFCGLIPKSLYSHLHPPGPRTGVHIPVLQWFSAFPFTVFRCGKKRTCSSKERDDADDLPVSSRKPMVAHPPIEKRPCKQLVNIFTTSNDNNHPSSGHSSLTLTFQPKKSLAYPPRGGLVESPFLFHPL